MIQFDEKKIKRRYLNELTIDRNNNDNIFTSNLKKLTIKKIQNNFLIIVNVNYRIDKKHV